MINIVKLLDSEIQLLNTHGFDTHLSNNDSLNASLNESLNESSNVHRLVVTKHYGDDLFESPFLQHYLQNDLSFEDLEACDKVGKQNLQGSITDHICENTDVLVQNNYLEIVFIITDKFPADAPTVMITHPVFNRSDIPMLSFDNMFTNEQWNITINLAKIAQMVTQHIDEYLEEGNTSATMVNLESMGQKVSKGIFHISRIDSRMQHMATAYYDIINHYHDIIERPDVLKCGISTCNSKTIVQEMKTSQTIYCHGKNTTRIAGTGYGVNGDNVWSIDTYIEKEIEIGSHLATSIANMSGQFINSYGRTNNYFEQIMCHELKTVEFQMITSEAYARYYGQLFPKLWTMWCRDKTDDLMKKKALKGRALKGRAFKEQEHHSLDANTQLWMRWYENMKAFAVDSTMPPKIYQLLCTINDYFESAGVYDWLASERAKSASTTRDGDGNSLNQQYTTEQYLGLSTFELCDSIDTFTYSKQLHIDNVNMQSMRRIRQEMISLQTNLPSTTESAIFVRAASNDQRRFRILLVPNPDTPYAYGSFFFDMALMSDFPHSPPKINFLTTGGNQHRFNPNLYACGKVCLSLLGTWTGNGGSENWSTNSTLLQLLISIQSLIFVEKPYFNEPGYEASMGTEHGEMHSDAYSKEIIFINVKVGIMNNLCELINEKSYPREFKKAMVLYYALSRGQLLAKLSEWCDLYSGTQKQHFNTMIETITTYLDKVTLISKETYGC